MHGSGLISVPEVCWDYCARRVMVMEWMTGVPVSHTDTLREMNVDFAALARDGVEVFLHKCFAMDFFMQICTLAMYLSVRRRSAAPHCLRLWWPWVHCPRPTVIIWRLISPRFLTAIIKAWQKRILNQVGFC